MADKRTLGRLHRKKRNKYFSFIVDIIGMILMVMVVSRTGNTELQRASIIAAMVIVPLSFLTLSIRTFADNRLLRKSMKQIDRMTGEEFEDYLRAYFAKRGYKVCTTKVTGDYGADLVMKKGGKKTIVQAKRYKGKVGIKAVQEIIAAKAFYKADHCAVATTSYFTKPAKQLAEANKVTLWDRDVLFGNNA